ncbi:dTDP-4-dehydrorhamnose 3,5-epimerase [Austwickia chelonae]|uniref:dTDP-4-dehydrorhamnose reductase n=1 Tax=Austwickia chelonae NBRC 105200 TaxID=1184607 RepID=K6VUP8_9MICO|nr:sugar nucleotide-binding protein [Austwickia chelonae]GAB79035.1 dTDP-6-deoxy-D-xylo-4-hexulose 3,5-epimerase/dTDP-6-deoxy-L-lyxo-4-hexulose reductase [Austwickia chelonae NBRC 105200]SEW41764.1 dTDP-4-dehydrorhamnose 3,5-epimerase [Austwickia chelonae]
MTGPTLRNTEIPGLLVLTLPVHGDQRGWFKENWQREKMTAAGLPDFGPVQHNVSFNAGHVTRGFHAEPWDKLVSVVTGRVFGAWVDLRSGPTFGQVVTTTIDPGAAVFVPRGVANAYQSLEEGTAYTYLVNDHWSPQATAGYTFVNLADPALGVDWPLPLAETTRSPADLDHPPLAEVTPLTAGRCLVLGADGQLGRALRTALPEAEFLTRADCDLSDANSLDRIDWSGVDSVINAAAYTSVDHAEKLEGRRQAWAVNVDGVARLVDHARKHRFTLVHVSSDYVFDGTVEEHHEDEPFSPLGVYGVTKAAGDRIVAGLPRHYLVRTSWVVGEGRNFVSTMADLAGRGVCPDVVDDQYGRLTFTQDLAAGIVHLLQNSAPYGTYNLSNSGPAHSWAQIAAEIFRLCGRNPEEVTPVSTSVYGTGRDMAPRPRHSALRLDKIIATGFTPPPAAERLAEMVCTQRS